MSDHPVSRGCAGRRRRGRVATAFEWAHANRDNAKPKDPRDGETGRRERAKAGQTVQEGQILAVEPHSLPGSFQAVPYPPRWEPVQPGKPRA